MVTDSGMNTSSQQYDAVCLFSRQSEDTPYVITLIYSSMAQIMKKAIFIVVETNCNKNNNSCNHITDVYGIDANREDLR